MRIFLFLFTFFAGIGLVGPTAKEAAAQCTHLGAQGACPVGIPNGSNSISFNANGTINWSNGGISGPCCAQPSGTETGAGLLNLNNALGGTTFNPRTPLPNETDAYLQGPNVVITDGSGNVIINAGNWPDNSCSGSDCTTGPGAAIFGANPNSGYLCDGGGAGCGNDVWVGLPQPGFGECGPGGCTGAAPIPPIDFGSIPSTGPYSQNSTTGNFDPFGGGSSFVDPVTGISTTLPYNPDEWPDRVKLADALNTAYVNGEIGYPFNDPNWDKRSVQFYKDNPVQAPVTPAGQSVADTSRAFEFYQAENAGTTPGPAVPDDLTPVLRVQPGDNLFRIALRYGVTLQSLAEANGISVNTPLTVGQVLTIPVSVPAPAPVGSGETTATVPARPGPGSGRPGRFGIGADTTLAGDNGLAARFQVAKNFGVQAVISFTRLESDVKNENADLTNYVNAAVASTQAGTRPADFVSVLPVVTPAPASRASDETPDDRPEPRSEITNLTFAGSGRSGVARIDTEGEASVYQVTTASGRRIDFKSRSDAFFFSNQLNNNSDGKTVDVLLAELPAGRAPINTGPATTNPIDAIVESVPKEFQAPRVNDGAPGEFSITDPRTNQTIRVLSPQQRDAALNAMRNGATLEQAAEIAKDAPVVTPDGLASASSRGNASTPSTPAPPGSAPTITNLRPAIIVPPTPTRPEGTTAGNMKALLNGEAYDIEVIRTPDGKMLAVGTGENAGHVFGEVKETSNKLFGDFRREGPWTPPPGKTTDTATAAPATQTTAPQRTPPLRAANNQVRSQIANSDRDYMTQPVFTDGFESGDASPWRSTEP